MKKIKTFMLPTMMLALFIVVGCRVEPMQDPRTGKLFSEREIRKLQPFANECRASLPSDLKGFKADNKFLKSRMSKKSIRILVKKHGFKNKKQVNKLCSDYQKFLLQM